MSDQPAAVRPSFMKAFIPGLVLGLAVGLLGGAYIGGLMESNGASGNSIPAGARGGTAVPRDTRPVTPTATPEVAPTTPEGTAPPAPATPETVPATPLEEPKTETPAAPK